MSIRVGVVSEYLLYRESLTSLVSGDPEVEVLVATNPQGIAALLARGADVLLLDVDHGEPAPASHHIPVTAREARVIVVGVGETPEELFGWLEAGAHGYVSRKSGRAGLLKVIRAAANRKLRFPPVITETLITRLQRHGVPADGAGWEALTPREKEIKALKDRHFSNKDIADRLHIEVATVKTHVHNICGKAHFHGFDGTIAGASPRSITRPPLSEELDPIPSRM